LNNDQPGATGEAGIGNAVPGSRAAHGNELSGVVGGAAVQAAHIQGSVNISLAQPAASPAPVPAQLPPAPAHFTNRAAELALLDDALAGPDPARRLSVVVINGSGGAGKTSLGVHWLHQVSTWYEGGALYADLRGHERDAAARPADVLAGFLRALGTSPAPLALDELAALYRTVTSGRRMLVFLDNAASAAQVRALLPGPGPRADPRLQPGGEGQERPSMVLVTTRWRLASLATEGARFIEVGPLDEVSAAELFARMAGADRVAAEPDAARAVVRMCAGLPLAICVAGAHTASRSRRPIARLAADLGIQQQRLAMLAADDLSVSSAFDTTYSALPAEVARSYRELAASCGPGSPGASAGRARSGPAPGSAISRPRTAPGRSPAGTCTGRRRRGPCR
jgi:hypothetical protein